MRDGFKNAWDKRADCAAAEQQFKAGKAEFVRKIEPLFKVDKQDIDIAIYPTTPYFPELIELATEDSITGVILAPFTGYPSMSIPIGFSSGSRYEKQGLPFGLTILAKPGREDLLIKAAYSYQKKFGEVKLPFTVQEEVPHCNKGVINILSLYALLGALSISLFRFPLLKLL